MMNVTKSDEIKILIAGDFCPFIDWDKKDQYDNIKISCEDIKGVVKTPDFSIVNLECPVADYSCKRIEKIGPNLSCSTSEINIIKEIGFKAVTLANNHILDYGEKALAMTIDALDDIGIDHMGAGENIAVASEVFYKNIKGKNIAFINCCEREFSIATSTRGGAMPLDITDLFYIIQKAKRNSDYVIVITHGGIEQYQHPSPKMVDTYRLLVDFGANIIINHHQHCYCGYEIYNGAPIFYGLGNFYFQSLGKTPQSWYNGYMVQIVINDDMSHFELIPYQQNVEPFKISLLNIKEREIFYNNIKELNSIISNKQVLEDKYETLLKNSSYKIISPFSNRYLQACVRRGYIPSFIPKSVLRNLYNKITCVSHLDRFLAYLEKEIS